MSRALRYSIILLLLMVCYVGSYFFLVRQGAATYFRGTNRTYNSPNYGPVPVEVFTPIHWLDKKVLRPTMWCFPGTLDEYMRYMGWDRPAP